MASVVWPGQVARLENPPEVTAHRLNRLSVPQADFLRFECCMIQLLDFDHAVFRIKSRFESWPIGLTRGYHSDVGRHCGDNGHDVRDTSVLGIWRDQQVLLALDLIIVDVGPIEHHELVVAADDDVLRDLFETILVMDWVDHLCSIFPEGTIEGLGEVDIKIVLESEGKATIGLPLTMDIGVYRRHDWDDWCDCEDFDAGFALGGSNVPGGPSSFRCSTHDPTIDVGVFVDLEELLGCFHALEGCFSHRKVDQRLRLGGRGAHELVPRPGHERVLAPLSSLWIICPLQRSIWHLLNGNCDGL